MAGRSCRDSFLLACNARVVVPLFQSVNFIAISSTERMWKSTDISGRTGGGARSRISFELFNQMNEEINRGHRENGGDARSRIAYVNDDL